MADRDEIVGSTGIKQRFKEFVGGIFAQTVAAIIYVKSAAEGDTALTGDAVNGLDVDVTREPVYTAPATGELAGATVATQMPNVACRLLKFKAAYDNAGRVYIGGNGVTKADGVTDTTTGYQLSAGEETGWIPVDNLSRFWRISDNAGDDLTFLALA